MRKIALLVFCLFTLLPSTSAQDYFGGAQWIGAIHQEQARLPEGRYHNESRLKDPEVKAAWAAVDPLSRQIIVLRRSFKPLKAIEKAELRICGLGFY